MLMASFVSPIFADGLSAMLKNGDGLIRLYYGTNCLKSAYNAADSGSVITLSAGIFSNVPEIRKGNITIIGNGGLDDSLEKTEIEKLAIIGDSVTVDGLDVSTLYLVDTRHCKVLHCDITSVSTHYNLTSYYSYYNHYSTVVDQCCIRYDNTCKYAYNYLIKNSTIYSLGSSHDERTNVNIFILNCVIYNFIASCQTAICKNSIIRMSNSDGTITLPYPSEYYYNTFLSNSYIEGEYFGEGNSIKPYDSIEELYPASMVDLGTGTDGTLRGPYGGTGFYASPNIPRITSRMIDHEPDKEGKLNVKISVKTK